MTKLVTFDVNAQTVALDRELNASLAAARPDPPVPVDGYTFGVATMRQNSPHGGELHADGDEVLYLIAGRVRVVFLDGDYDDIEVAPGDGLIVPKGTWHRVDILEPSQIVYLTPGPDNRFRPLAEV